MGWSEKCIMKGSANNSWVLLFFWLTEYFFYAFLITIYLTLFNVSLYPSDKIFSFEQKITKEISKYLWQLNMFAISWKKDWTTVEAENSENWRNSKINTQQFKIKIKAFFGVFWVNSDFRAVQTKTRINFFANPAIQGFRKSVK